MNAALLFPAELLICITVSLSVVRVLSRPLVNVLSRICPDEHAAVFWLTYTKIMLMLAPLLLVLVVDLASQFTDPMSKLRLSMVAALAGLLVGMHSVGKRLGKFIVTPKDEGSTP